MIKVWKTVLKFPTRDFGQKHLFGNIDARVESVMIHELN